MNGARRVALHSVLFGLALAAGHAAGQAPTARPGGRYAYPAQMSEGQVTIEVRPVWWDSVLIVQLAARTQSVMLGANDLSRQVRLVVGDRRIAPVAAGRLHDFVAGADVVFRLDRRPERFQVEIRNIPDVPLRVLTWPPHR